MEPRAEDVARALGGAPSGDGWMAHCPAHEDRTPSLSLRNTPTTGRLLWMCHAGCSQGAVKAALEARGLHGRNRHGRGASQSNNRGGDGPWFVVNPVPPDAPPPPDSFGKLGQPSQRWPFHDARGRIVYYELRFDLPNRGKEIRPLTLWSDGKRYQWRLRGFPPPRPLYGLPELVRRIGAPVLVVEGAKTADAARSIFPEHAVVTWTGGVKNADKTDWTPLQGRVVTIWSDHDEPGERAAQDVARLAQAAGAGAVTIVALPDDLPPKWDLADPLPAGWDTEQLHGLLDAATQWEDAALPNSASDEWPEPRDLPANLPPVASFDTALLPTAFRLWIEDITERMQCPPDFPAVAAMVALAAVVGRQVSIRPMYKDDWLVVPNLWGMVVGRPGVLKTPAMREPLLPLEEMEAEGGYTYNEAMRRWKATQIVESEREKIQRERVRKALKEDKTTDDIVEKLLHEAKSPPIRRRWIANDTTVEMLGVLLNQNPNGLLLFRDELSGFLRSLDREGHEGARAFYLEAWNGTGRFTYDRIGRGTVEIEAACVSVLGSIQPGPLGDYVRATFGGGVGDDGLLQRFQLTVYPEVSRDWHNIDRAPDAQARKAARDTLHRLASLDPNALGAQRDDHTPIPFLRFASDAYAKFIEWRQELEPRVRAGTELPALEAHLAKYRSLVPSLALLIHLADGATGPVSLAALERALGWAVYLESHARRLYAPAVDPELAAAHALDARIRAGHLPPRFPMRDVYRKGWTYLKRPDEVQTALTTLETHDRVRLVQEETGGRPSLVCIVNPRLAVQRKADKPPAAN